MAQRHESAFCRHCQTQVLTVGERPAHLVHGIITFLGLVLFLPLLFWAIIWILACVTVRDAKCTRCGGNIREMNRAAAVKASRERRRELCASFSNFLLSRSRVAAGEPVKPRKVNAKLIGGAALALAALMAMGQLAKNPTKPDSEPPQAFIAVAQLGEANPEPSPAARLLEADWAVEVKPALSAPSTTSALIYVPTDSKASYFVENVTKMKKGMARIVSRPGGA